MRDRITKLPWIFLRNNHKFFPVHAPSDFLFLNVSRNQTSLNGFISQSKREVLVKHIEEELKSILRLKERGFFLDAAEKLISLPIYFMDSGLEPELELGLVRAEHAIADAKELCIACIESGDEMDAAKIMLSKVLCTNALLHQESGDLHLAIDAYKSAIETMTEVTGNRFHPTNWRFYSDLVLALMAHESYSEALHIYTEIYDRAHPKIELPHHFYHRESVWQEKNINLGIISSLSSDNHKSMWWFKKSLAEVGSLNNNFSAVLALYNLSALHLKLENNHDALQMMQKAQDLYCDLNKGVDTSQHRLFILMNNFIGANKGLETHARFSGR